jgi:hypothetical protein
MFCYTNGLAIWVKYCDCEVVIFLALSPLLDNPKHYVTTLGEHASISGLIKYTNQFYLSGQSTKCICYQMGSTTLIIVFEVIFQK